MFYFRQLSPACPCDLTGVTAVLPSLGENQRWPSLRFPKGWESWKMGGLPAPQEPCPCLILLIIIFKTMLTFEFKGLWGTLKARSKALMPQGDAWPL